MLAFKIIAIILGATCTVYVARFLFFETRSRAQFLDKQGLFKATAIELLGNVFLFCAIALQLRCATTNSVFNTNIPVIFMGGLHAFFFFIELMQLLELNSSKKSVVIINSLLYGIDKNKFGEIRQNIATRFNLDEKDINISKQGLWLPSSVSEYEMRTFLQENFYIEPFSDKQIKYKATWKAVVETLILCLDALILFF